MQAYARLVSGSRAYCLSSTEGLAVKALQVRWAMGDQIFSEDADTTEHVTAPSAKETKGMPCIVQVS